MPPSFLPIVRNFPHLLHGGDYNPEQWRRTPEVWDEDFRLLRDAGCNTVTVGVFAWSSLEPAEGQFNFGWMDAIFDKCQSNGVRVVLATPGGGKPAWLAQKYPEVLRVGSNGIRDKWGGRHNHCFTSPGFRQKCQIINAELAERYGQHPMLALWHLNNEYGGECQCNLCADAFRAFLRRRYHDDLAALNGAWYSTFWSHTISDWSQIDPPAPADHGHRDQSLVLDWRRFVTHQTIDCFRAECEPLRRITPDVPITTNLMLGGFTHVDYYDLADACDVVAWDSYPAYHDRPGDYFGPLGPAWISFIHSQRRAMKKRPFLLMEMSPGAQNYKPVCKLKRPGVHTVEALQAIAHGSNSVQYFQIRKSRGGAEQFHGAMIDHHGGERTRTFKEVAELGQILRGLDDVVGTCARPEVAFIYDYQNRWALDESLGPVNGKKDKDYDPVVREHYRPFWSAGVDVDVISMDASFDGYKLIVAPMLYMVRPGVAERLEKFVAAGGTLVLSFFSGVVDQCNVCFTTGFPGPAPLRKLAGVWVEEIDALYDDEKVKIAAADGNVCGLSGEYTAGFLCDLLHAEAAQVQATYASEFYAGRPAVTMNSFGRGRAYYVAARCDAKFNTDFYNRLIDDLGVRRALHVNLPDGVTAATRGDFIFLLSFRPEACDLDLGQRTYRDRLTGTRVSGPLKFPPYGAMILERA